jgi:DNA-binding protein HU-beta
MNKSEFKKHISTIHNCSQQEADKVINMFTDSITAALAKGNKVSLIGFGNFSVAKVAAREGRNPRTAEPIKIAACNQPKFKAGQKLKDTCNS